MSDHELIKDIRDEADLCANEGVTELAALLNTAAHRIECLLSVQACQPLTDEQIEDEWERVTGHSIFGGCKKEGRAMYISPDEVYEFARAIHSFKEQA